MRKLLLPSSRPLFWIILYFMIGIIGGHIGIVYTDMPLFYIVLIGICLVSIPIIYSKRIGWLILGLALIVGFLCYSKHPVNQEGDLYNYNEVFIGTIKEIDLSGYEGKIILGAIQLPEMKISLETNLLVKVPKTASYQVGNIIKIYGKTNTISETMNPSDFDYKNYLKGQQIIAEITPSEIEIIDNQQRIASRLKEALINQIEQLFDKEIAPIIIMMLLGEDRGVERISEAYYNVGIGHLLAISGLHIGILFGVIWMILGMIKIPYIGKIITALCLTWFYIYMIGLSVSAVRAGIVLTVVYGGRMLFEEEDEWIALAVGAFIILLENPFQLFQVGFQLSFFAYSGILIANQMRNKLKIPYVLSLNLFISCMTWPIIAWHFYEIAIIGFILNFVVVPLFGIIIPWALVTLLISFPLFNIGSIMAFFIEELLLFVGRIVSLLENISFGTWVVGKPSIIMVITFYLILGVWITYRIDSKIRKEMNISLAISIAFLLESVVLQEKLVDITHLYVGQGDSCVIMTPSRHVVIIDGGNEGSEKTITNYLKYKGINKVDVAIVSHPHADHIGGIIGLFEEDVKIDQVIAPVTSELNEWAERLDELCILKGAKQQIAQYIDELILGEVVLEFLYPKKQIYDDNSNNASIVCLLQYGNYKQLFTGDIESEGEQLVLPVLEPIDVLKVAHHGSNTSTTASFLNQVEPRVGIISCGINNWYNHPSPKTLDVLENRGVDYYRTDLSGAIHIVSNGESYQVKTYR